MNNWHIKNIGGRLLMAAMGVLCLVGCDYSRLLVGSPVKYSTENGKMFVKATCFIHRVYDIWIDLKGEYAIQPDSLKLYVHHNAVKALNVRFKTISEYKKNQYSIVELKGDTTITNIATVVLSFNLGMKTERQAGEKTDIDTCYFAVLPCDFIMCNGKRVITDTIRFKFTEHPEYKGLSGQFKYHKQLDKEFNADD